MVNNSPNIKKNHLSHQRIEWCQQFQQYQQKSPLTSTHWMMVNNSTNINQNSMSWGERWFLLILMELLTITQWVYVRDDVCWYWWNCWPSFNELKWEVIFVDIGGLSDGQQFNQYQQTSPLTLTHWVMVNNTTNINKNHLSP
jgi:hypothetical protein